MLEQTINKYLSTSSKLNKKSISKTLKALEDHKFIRTFTLKNDKYYLLIKDFYLIRVPPKEVIELLQKKSEIPRSIRERYLTSIRQFFASYVKSSNKLITDFEANLIEVISNHEITTVLNLLRKKPIDLKAFKKKISNFELIQKLLIKFDLIEIISERENSESWVFLKTDLNMNIFFPEYLIKSITENLNNKKINKLLALLNEKPEMYQELRNRINTKLEIIQSLEKKGEKPLEEAIGLKKLYKQIGDFDNRQIWQKKLREWENS